MALAYLILLCTTCVVGILAAHDGPITATVRFNQQGVVGNIVFTQLENGSIQVDTSFLPGDFSSWHVHLFPVDFTADPATRCNPMRYLGPHLDPSNRLGAAGDDYSTVCNPGDPLRCEAGDLSGKFGDLSAGNFTYVDTDPEFQLEGRYSIVGRSVIIHPPGGGHLACGNIYLDGDEAPDIYAATFLGSTVAGAIYFRQSDFEPDIGVYIYANLYYTDGSDSNTMNHRWGVYTNQLNPVDYPQGNCDNLGTIFNPTNSGADNPQCSPSNIDACRVGDLSAKLGNVIVNANPANAKTTAWTDANLYNYTIVWRSIGLRVADNGDGILACAPILPVTGITARANRPPNNSLFTLRQQSPFDPTAINLPANLPAGDYQINTDGNIRTDDTCYSDMVFTPFTPDNQETTLESFAAGNLSAKHDFVADSTIEDIILPLSTLSSALGHNFVITPYTGNLSCGTIDLPLASNDNVIIVTARAYFNDSVQLSGSRVYMRQAITKSDDQQVPGPTVINTLLQYAQTGMSQTTGHGVSVHMGRCSNRQGVYNPYGVSVGDAVEMVVCNEAIGSRFQQRCAAGDLTGKFGQFTIRAEGTSPRTLVVTDSNLPLVGPYTVFGRSFVIYSSTDSTVLACGNILPETISDTQLELSFPTISDVTVDNHVSLPVAIVDLLDNVVYGEVFVTLVLDASQGCTTIRLGFTSFSGTKADADATAMKVRQLNQNRLPEMYRRGNCAEGDLQESKGFSIQPHILLLTILAVAAVTSYMLG